MNHINLTYESPEVAKVFFNSVYVGEFYKEVDGFFVFEPPPQSCGFWNAGFIRAIADKLDELNKDWNEQINKYFDGE